MSLQVIKEGNVQRAKVGQNKVIDGCVLSVATPNLRGDYEH